LGLTRPGVTPDVKVFDTAAGAVASADFIQESIPERLDAKRALYGEIEPAMKPDAILATSSSGLKLTDLQAGWRDPSRIIIAHPFNPPHLIPLVELYANERTAEGVLDRSARFYEGCGKVTITLKREVLAHVANRLQAALWREAISLVADGVASLEDVDAAVTSGPGLRWAIMGPHLLFNLGGGEAGLRAYCEQFRDSYHFWWDDLGRPKLTSETIDKLVDGLKEEIGGRSYEALRQERDAKLVSVLKAIKEVDRANDR
jgi:carnitine 3-dehydrogenase